MEAFDCVNQEQNVGLLVNTPFRLSFGLIWEHLGSIYGMAFQALSKEYVSGSSLHMPYDDVS